MSYETNEVYIGMWKNDKFNGKGTLSKPNGEWYVGMWKDGKKQGVGIEYT